MKQYTGRTMAEALAQVREDLGSHGVILHTRTFKRGGVFGLLAREMVEITAAHSRDIARSRRQESRERREQLTDKLRGLPRRSGTSHTSRGGMPRTPASVVADDEYDSASTPMAGDLIRRTYQAARAEMQTAPARQHDFPREAQPASSSTATATLAPPAGASASHALNNVEPVGPSAQQLAEEMKAVRRLVGKALRQQQVKPAAEDALPALNDPLMDEYLNLLKQEVTEELAEEVIEQVRSRLTEEQADDSAAVHKEVMRVVGRMLPIQNAEQLALDGKDGRPRVIALIGPTGVGKTTTIAKLAATFRLKQQKKVGLITLDTYRIAAVDQLQTYANIIGVPLRVVTTAEELSEAIEAFSGCDAVLIDTAGRSQRDDPRLDHLRSLLDAAEPDEVHLVLSSNSSMSVMLETAERFSKVRADRILFTKLDEAVSFGVLLNVAHRVNKQLSYVTTGQEVPHQIEPSSTERLAALVTGDQKIL